MLSKEQEYKLAFGIAVATIVCATLLLVSSRVASAVHAGAMVNKIAIERVTPGTVTAVPIPADNAVGTTVTAQKATAPKKSAPAAAHAKAQPNKIIIPQMGVDAELLEGFSVKTLNKGIWHLPGTSNPKKGGNMVIGGHRYKWLPPSKKTFWHLDKMKKGDEFMVLWEGVTHRYRVSAVSIVTPDAVEILNNTTTHKVTLFTCTPKFSSKYRLVVEATPIRLDSVTSAMSGS